MLLATVCYPSWMVSADIVKFIYFIACVTKPGCWRQPYLRYGCSNPLISKNALASLGPELTAIRQVPKSVLAENDCGQRDESAPLRKATLTLAIAVAELKLDFFSLTLADFG